MSVTTIMEQCQKLKILENGYYLVKWKIGSYTIETGELVHDAVYLIHLIISRNGILLMGGRLRK